MMKRVCSIFAAMFLLAAIDAAAVTFQVAHLHFWGSCRGKLVFSDTRVEFLPEEKRHAHAWNYQDIQQLALAQDRISILTYTRTKTKLGADRVFKFKLLSGKVDEQFRNELEKKLPRPLVSSVVPEKIQVQFVIPVRHRLFLADSRGCWNSATSPSSIDRINQKTRGYGVMTNCCP